MTVREALAEGAARLRAASVATPDLDAELLLRHVLGWDRARLLASLADPVPEAALRRLAAFVEGRAHRRPLQHVTGVQQFWGREFEVSAEALIPRPETEVLVEVALQALRDLPSPVVVDVGTGTGCIALSLAGERADAVVHAVDASPAALALARRNARRLGLEGRVEWHRGSLLEPLLAAGIRADLVVSNPPYVEEHEWGALEPEVRDHEPRQALVPEGGLDAVYGALATQAARVLRPGGVFAVEIGAGQHDRIARTARAAGFSEVTFHEDLQRIVRVVRGILAAPGAFEKSR